MPHPVRYEQVSRMTSDYTLYLWETTSSDDPGERGHLHGVVWAKDLEVLAHSWWTRWCRDFWSNPFNNYWRNRLYTRIEYDNNGRVFSSAKAGYV